MVIWTCFRPLLIFVTPRLIPLLILSAKKNHIEQNFCILKKNKRASPIDMRIVNVNVHFLLSRLKISTQQKCDFI
jgi:hypothetical protein